MSLTVYQGICKGGPLDGKVQTRQGSRLNAPGHSGFYIYQPAKGPTPGTWLWIEKKGQNDGKI